MGLAVLRPYVERPEGSERQSNTRTLLTGLPAQRKAGGIGPGVVVTGPKLLVRQGDSNPHWDCSNKLLRRDEGEIPYGQIRSKRLRF